MITHGGVGVEALATGFFDSHILAGQVFLVVCKAGLPAGASLTCSKVVALQLPQVGFSQLQLSAALVQLLL